MAITNNASYVPTMNEFLAHWALVDGGLGATMTVVTEKGAAVTLVAFEGMRNDLEALSADVIDALNDQEIARGDIDIKKAQMLRWLNEFDGLLDAYWASTAFHNARPKAPGISDGQERFLTPMRDMASLWVKLNAASAPEGITLPLALSDGTLQAAFQTALSALQTAYATEKNAQQDADITRADRDRTKASAYATMKAYRVAVPARCAQLPLLVETMPILTPVPGHTPDPVNASAVFEAPDQARVGYDASEDAMLDHYELRGNPGTAYNEVDAITIATHEPEDAREFLTSFGLTLPGATVALKVYVILTTGNEAGSATMLVTRPA